MLLARKKTTIPTRQRWSQEQILASAAILHKPRYVPDRLARARTKITVLIFFLVLAGEIAWGFKPRNPVELIDPWIATGSIAILLGLVIRSWAAGMLIKKKKLACHGPYALVRHPLYLGSILMMLGFTLLTGIWWNLLVAGVTAWLCFGHAIHAEEAFLAARFTDRWTSYAASTGGLLPRGIAGNLAAAWNWKRWARNREFNAWLGAAAGWLGLIAWHWF